ncbi:hypothetical protein A4D02_27465 [Niastella koreensis]|uniref:Uncharacterized protein n=2 Tax=Niastella koreensis TaxID=354356 RepID=G8TGX9_NIAKG|nr:hypothetical protein [Niastella koreensis]AEV99581.1 hypothetical protein Niako_3255 [Niastella koreensis GR20-10]OQP50172.1 hypothetical protein A4D02_27465 [Niastella koreensis]
MACINNLFKNRLLITLFLLGSCFFFADRVKAQENQKARASLSEQEWKAVTGIFQSPQNNDMNVRFTARDNMLIAKLLWNGNELHLLPESPLEFSSNQEGNQESVHITFIKDSSGAVNEVKVADNGVWKRNNNYTPLTKKEIELSPDQLKQFEGLYQFQGDATRFIEFSLQGGQLVLKQSWDGEQRFFVPESAMDFFVKDFPLFTLNFSKDKDGNINQVIAFKKDVWVKSKKHSLSVNELKSYEGKFRSNDDPDNIVQLTVVKDHLVIKQLWDKTERVLQPKTDCYFISEGEFYPVVIHKNKDAVVNEITVLGTSVFSRIN